MKLQAHSVFIIFLLFVGILAVLSLSAHGLNYYLTPIDQRPFSPDYPSMKPSGPYSHGLGIIGSLMIIVGVSMYSTRKRIRALHSLWRLSRWLEIHIFLCLLGPILVVYHTTFKVGGIAAITFWTMLSVAASGVVGRFLYTQIPRNLNGNELTIDEVDAEIQRLGATLRSSEVGGSLVQMIDDLFAAIPTPRTISQTFSTIVKLQQIKSVAKKKIRNIISLSSIAQEIEVQIRGAASARVVLLQKSLVLSQVERLFFYWHAVHLPFTIIMFITLAAHVTVVVLLGYRWIL